MKNSVSFNGQTLINMFTYSSYYLEKYVATLNSLNVFPVPDGDTGTNMLITIKEVMKSIENENSCSASYISNKMSEAALMGAKGNSGVILSQFFKGFETTLKSKTNFGYEEFIISLERAVQYCYKAVGTPTEGTILTIINVAARSARKLYDKGTSPDQIMNYTCKDVKTSVLKTPESLAVLQNAGVIDSGALGLYIILEGIRIYLEGKSLYSTNIDFPENLNINPINLSNLETKKLSQEDDDIFGNCIQFFILSNNINIDEVKKEIEKFGSSIVAVGSNSKIKIHVHSQIPDKLIKSASKYGEIAEVTIENMDEQHNKIVSTQITPPQTILFSIAPGKKLNNIFTEFGAINFNIEEEKYDQKGIESVILQSNFKNAILLLNGFMLKDDSILISNEFIHILNTNNIAEGITAILNYNPELNIHKNISNMKSSYSSITSIEIYKSTINTEVYNNKICQNDYYAIYNNKLISKNNNIIMMLNELFENIDLSDKDFITIYKGNNTSNSVKESVSKYMTNKLTNAELEIIEGEYNSNMLIISIE